MNQKDAERSWEAMQEKADYIQALEKQNEELLFEIEGLTDWKDVKKLKHLAEKIKTVMEENSETK